MPLSPDTFPPPPVKELPDKEWEHYVMWERINDLIYSLPNYFDTELVIKGINVTEIFSIGTAFTTVIEAQVVDILNRLRTIWDPQNRYSEYRFIRQSQTFPDVLLRHVVSNEILFGIELKSWYLLSKEDEPSFRYKVTPDACASPDLLVIIPWILSEVISGEPRLLSVYKESAQFAARYRNYYWQRSRLSSNRSAIITPPPPSNRRHYPDSKQEASDQADDDKGGNFGRIARAGLLDDYIVKLKAEDYLGIKISHWIEFFKAISETSSNTEIDNKIDGLRRKILAESSSISQSPLLSTFLEVLEQLEKLWQELR
ncbi:MAG: hypothetical protein HND44_23600 [Chloroflexi bacterium]|nr:hypothetical protein [Ardenticatenaceae bacterium]NOG37529.1 hypothetical protein [Chloroflexota bacterium]